MDQRQQAEMKGPLELRHTWSMCTVCFREEFKSGKEIKEFPCDYSLIHKIHFVILLSDAFRLDSRKSRSSNIRA